MHGAWPHLPSSSTERPRPGPAAWHRTRTRRRTTECDFSTCPERQGEKPCVSYSGHRQHGAGGTPAGPRTEVPRGHPGPAQPSPAKGRHRRAPRGESRSRRSPALTPRPGAAAAAATGSRCRPGRREAGRRRAGPRGTAEERLVHEGGPSPTDDPTGPRHSGSGAPSRHRPRRPHGPAAGRHRPGPARPFRPRPPPRASVTAATDMAPPRARRQPRAAPVGPGAVPGGSRGGARGVPGAVPGGPPGRCR